MYSCKAKDDMRMSCKFKNVTFLTFCYSVVLPLSEYFSITKFCQVSCITKF